MEHYEISRYGTLKSWAKQLGFNDAADLLDETLQEEKRSDMLLSKMAEKLVNLDAGKSKIKSSKGEVEDDKKARKELKGSASDEKKNGSTSKLKKSA